MMIDYNVTDHWSADDPDWLKSLVSSLDRGHGVSTVLPLTVVVAEVIDWLALASGVDAWKKAANRRSLQLDLNQSIDALGASLRAHIAPSLARFQETFSRLIGSSTKVLAVPPGTRVDAVWTEASAAAEELLAVLDTDEAVRASWDELVAAAQDRTMANREYRPIAELLFDQLRRHGLNAEWIFRDLASIIAYGREGHRVHTEEIAMSHRERLVRARYVVGTPAEMEPIVVWLGYQGRILSRLTAGRVTFIDAHWAVPNAKPDGQDFEHKAELWELVRGGFLFKVAMMVNEKSDVDCLVCVDLGKTTSTGAVTRAAEIVNTILNVSIHNSRGVRPHLAQYGVLRSGRLGSFNPFAFRPESGFSDDHYAARVTEAAIKEHGLRIAEALARDELPRFLAAALEVQSTADHPFSRDMALREPSEADISSVIPSRAGWCNMSRRTQRSNRRRCSNFLARTGHMLAGSRMCGELLTCVCSAGVTETNLSMS